MISQINIDNDSRCFLTALYEKTSGDESIQVSMYDIGDLIGLDKDASVQMAEFLIGEELVEIRTLSGGIAITAEGSKRAVEFGAALPFQAKAGPKLNNGPIISDTGRQSVEQVENNLKGGIGSLGLDFDAAADLIAEFKTIDAQLTSSKPKTSVIRECFLSIEEILEKAKALDYISEIKDLLDMSSK